MLKQKIILVTGGAGFIGSHLCDALIARGERVICLDNLFTGSRANFRHLLRHPRFTFVRHDIIDPIRLTARRVDQVYNLACPASPIHYQKNAIRTIKANTIGVINVLGLAKKYRARVLQASTSEVYGDPKEHPQRESYRGNVNMIGPRSCYDEGKRVAETLFFDYHRAHGLEIRVARIFNTYGPRMAIDDGRVISNFIVQALRGKPLTIYGIGTQTRPLCYVSDLVGGLIRLMEQNKTTGPVNLGNPRERTILEIAHAILRQIHSRSRLVRKPLPEDDPRQRKPDITLARTLLGWQPRVPLREGLAQTLNYFHERIAN